MEAIPKETRSVPIPVSLKCPQEDDALSWLFAKDPVLGQVLKIIMGKLDETNKKLEEMNEKLDDTNEKLDETNEKLDDTNEKLDETNEKLDGMHNELRRDIDKCQGQVNKLQNGKGTMENDQATTTEIIQTMNAEELERKRREIIHDCLGLPTILRRLLEQFSDKELINLSLVNKLWNFEARSVLRVRGHLKAKICSSPLCLTLVHFASDLKQMRVVPFTGIGFTIDHSGDDTDTCPAFPIGTLDSSYQVILDRLQLKHLSVDFYEEWSACYGCPALLLFQRILEDYSGVLEELSICTLDKDKTDFVQRIIQDRSFPCLKILKVEVGSWRTPLPSTGFIKALVCCAPNLEKFCMDGDIRFKENVLEGSSAVLIATDGLRPRRDGQVCESLISALRTEYIHVNCTDGDFDVTLLNRIVPMMMQASHRTLESLQMDLLFALPFMCYGICLENLTRLQIDLNATTVEGIQPNVMTLLKAFDFTRLFPKLNQVTINDFERLDFLPDNISGFIERGNALGREPLPDRAINIRHLELTNLKYAATMNFVAEMFPHVTTLSLLIISEQEFPFTVLWERFGCLVELDVAFGECSSSRATNLDSVFCGIFPEEVKELRKKDDEYLKTVNVVPVMPSITCMRGLRLFTLRYDAEVHDNREGPTLLFSKVTGLIGFRRCPALSVKLQIPSYSSEVLDHLRPYVTIVTESPS